MLLLRSFAQVSGIVGVKVNGIRERHANIASLRPLNAYMTLSVDGRLVWESTPLSDVTNLGWILITPLRL
jgi:hypothetical protein